jgi:hypothetical protein
MKSRGERGGSQVPGFDRRIEELARGMEGETPARMRALIREANPQMTEAWKWMGTPVWSHHGNVCTGEGVHQGHQADLRPGSPDLRHTRPVRNRASASPATRLPRIVQWVSRSL